MPIKTELMKISDMTEKLQLVGCSMLYAGICPIGTAIVFIYFIADEYMTRYTDCYCMQRPLQENQMSLGTWILVVEFIVGFVTISNSLVLFLVSQRFKDFLTYSLGIAPQNHLWFVGIFEHFLLATIIITKVMIPDFPRPLQKYFESTKKQLERFSQQQKKDKYKIVLEENKQLLALIAKQTNGKVNTKHLLKLAHERDKPPQLVDFFDFNNAQKSNQLLISGFDQCLINNMKQKVMRDTYFRLEQSVIAEKLAKLNFMNQSLIISCNKCNKVGADMYCDDCKSYFCPDCVEMHHAVNFKEHVYGKLDCGPKAKQTNIPLKRRRFSRYHSAEIEDGKADWKKLECFDFSVNNMSPKQNKFRNYFNNVYLLFIDLNDIDRNNGQLDLTQVFLAKNYSIFQKEIGLKYKEQKKKLINQVFQEKEILSFDELTKGQFNTEELSVMNRVAYCQFLKYGHHAKFDNFYNDLQIYQEGSFEDKITLWLSHLCLLNDKLTDHISQLFQEQVPIQQKRLGVDLLKKTINNSFPQEVRLGLIAGQIIESMFGSNETLKIDEIKSYLHKNEPAMLLMQCILQSHNENPE